MSGALRWTFWVGIDRLRTVTVVTDRGRSAAVADARAELDARAARRGDEPPVAWDLDVKRVADPGGTVACVPDEGRHEFAPGSEVCACGERRRPPAWREDAVLIGVPPDSVPRNPQRGWRLKTKRRK